MGVFGFAFSITARGTEMTFLLFSVTIGKNTVVGVEDTDGDTAEFGEMFGVFRTSLKQLFLHVPTSNHR